MEENQLGVILDRIFPQEDRYDDLFVPNANQILNKKSRKILLLSHNLTRTGAPLVLKDLAMTLLKNGDIPIVLSPVEGPLKEDFLNLGVTVIIRHNKGINSFKKKEFTDFFDLVVINTIIGCDAIKHLRFTRMPVIWWIHEGENVIASVEKELPRFFSENIKVYAVSQVVQEALSNVGIQYESELFHGGVNDTIKTLQKVERDSSKVQFILVGTLCYKKGQDILVKAFQNLSEKYKNSAEFTLIGIPLESDIVELVKKTEEENNNFHYMGELSREEVLTRIRSSDCIISASREDSLPVVLAEGFMLGKACLCSMSTGTSSFIKDGVSGFLFDESSIEELTRKIEYIIDNSSSLKRIGLNARKIYELEFTMQKFEDDVLNMISNNLEEGLNKSNTVLDMIEDLNKEQELEMQINRPRIYYDDGLGFSEDKKVLGAMIRNENYYEEKIFVPVNTNKIRFDPVDGKFCVLKNLIITSNLGVQRYTNVNGIDIGNYCIFDTVDPQILIDTTDGNLDWLKIETTIYTFEETDLQVLFSKFRRIPELLKEKAAIEEAKKEEINSIKEAIEQSGKQMLAQIQIIEDRFFQSGKKYQEEMDQITLINKEYEKNIQALSNSLKSKEQEVITISNNYLEQLRQNEDKIDSYSKEISERISRINYLENIIVDLKQQLADRDNVLQIYNNSTIWKMTKPIRVLLDIFKKLLKSNKLGILMFKGLISIKNDGIRSTFRKVKLYKQRQKNINSFIEQTGYDIGNDNMADFSPYDSEYQENVNFSKFTTDIKALAFYLPQFHTFPENDAWWGTGFTEWVNTRKATPRFEGHYQPREPHTDIGYYDLSNVETLRKQAELAKQHGIYGFCFYYYWFSGKRLMEKPVDMLLENPDIDLPFCLCWANESWTRAWDGRSKEVIMKQNYDDQDIELFIDNLKKYTDDSRYIRIHGKPVIIVYNPGEIPNIADTFSRWRKRAKETGMGDILIWTCQTANNTADNLKITSSVDAEVEFPPHNMWHDIIGIRNLDLKGKEAFIYNYQKLVRYLTEASKSRKKEPDKPRVHRSVMMGWDNAARRENKWTTFYAYSLKSFYEWLLLAMKEAREDFEPEERFIFINAWNEWAEGTYLEPDLKYGYANINTVSRALFDLPFDDRFKVLNAKENYDVNKFDDPNGGARIAVHIHLFYTDTIEEIIRNLNFIPYRYDCYISTDSLAKQQYIQMMFQKHCTCESTYVNLYPNRGRDVAPFLVQMSPVLNKYDYICHLHSKKTKTADYGDAWRKYLYSHLLGSREYLIQLFDCFERDKNLGLIFPETYPVLSNMAEWGGNKSGCKELLERLGMNAELPSEPVFPVGNMFWARTKAISSVFEYPFHFSNFPTESGQTNQTIAHQIERIWVYAASAFGYSYLKTFNNCLDLPQAKTTKRIALYVHYDKNNIISDEDVYFVKEFTKLTDEFIFITNSSVEKREFDKINDFVTKIIERSNVGFDFGAWKEGLFSYGFENLQQFDQLVLVNNSCEGPYFDFRKIFEEMEMENVDFWGLTLFPRIEDGSYINKEFINEHIQSYFQVFNRDVFQSKAFIDFWQNVKNYSELVDVVANCESEMTSILMNAGFKYSVYIKETKIMSQYLRNYSIPYELPVSLLLLRNPLVKKKCKFYMNSIEANRLKSLCNQLEM